jgi:hypothetical protein
MPSDLALRYRRLIGDERLEALWMAMCWTVVEPVTKPVDVDEVVRRLGGGGNEGCEQPVDLDDFNDRHDGSAFYVGQVGSAVAVLEVNGFQGSRSEVLRVLSDGARVHSVFWNVNSSNEFSYAVYGRTLASFAGTDPYHRYGDDPDVLNSDLADIFEARPDNDELDGDWRSAMLATAQHRTGVALDAEWLSRPHRYVVLPQLPSDPLPPIATSDVDLDAAYRLASQPAQHAARVWLIRRLAADFGFDADPEIAASIAAVAADQAAASGRGGSTAARIYSLTRIPADSSTLLLKREEFEAHPDRRRQDAGFALGTLLGLQTVSGPYPELHALLHAPLAYADQWPAIRTTVRRLLTR